MDREPDEEHRDASEDYYDSEEEQAVTIPVVGNEEDGEDRSPPVEDHSGDEPDNQEEPLVDEGDAGSGTAQELPPSPSISPELPADPENVNTEESPETLDQQPSPQPPSPSDRQQQQPSPQPSSPSDGQQQQQPSSQPSSPSDGQQQQPSPQPPSPSDEQQQPSPQPSSPSDEQQQQPSPQPCSDDQQQFDRQEDDVPPVDEQQRDTTPPPSSLTPPRPRSPPSPPKPSSQPKPVHKKVHTCRDMCSSVLLSHILSIIIENPGSKTKWSSTCSSQSKDYSYKGEEC